MKRNLYEEIKGMWPFFAFVAVPAFLIALGVNELAERHKSQTIKNLEETAVYADKESFRVVNEDINGNGKYETILMFKDMPLAQIEKAEREKLLIKPLYNSYSY